MPKKMTHEEVHAFLDSRPGWAMLSTLSADGFPHTVPLGYYRLGDDVVMGVRDRTAKVANIERNTRASVLLESGSSMADLRGVMLQGHAHVHRSPEDVLHYSREGARARGVPEAEWPSEPRPGAVYIRLTPDRILSWDYGGDS